MDRSHHRNINMIGLANPIENDDWQWVGEAAAYPISAYKTANVQLYSCPCSDHIFKIAKKQFRVVPIAEAWDYITQLRDDEDMVTFTTTDCEHIRMGHHVRGGFVTRDHTIYPFGSRDAIQLQKDSPMFILAAYSPYAAGRTLQCTHDHDHPTEYDMMALVRDFAHDADVRMLFANAIVPYTIAPELFHTHKGMVNHMTCYIQKPDVVQSFISLDYPLEPLVICEIVRMCSRKVQNQLMHASMDRDCVWCMVPKDVIKIIHRMVFDSYHTIAGKHGRMVAARLQEPTWREAVYDIDHHQGEDGKVMRPHE